MTGVRTVVNCGCGFTTTSLGAAEMHSNSTGHKMTVAGTVTPRVEMPKAGTQWAKTQRVEIPGMDDIQALRLKFS